MSSRSDSETTITLTPPCSKGVAIRSSKRKSSMKKEKTGKKRRRLEYEVVALFKDKKMEEKFDGSFVNKKVVNGRHNDLMEIKECGWDIVCFLKKKWTRFLMHMNCRSKLHDDESS